jgi:hypothetical protein
MLVLALPRLQTIYPSQHARALKDCRFEETLGVRAYKVAVIGKIAHHDNSTATGESRTSLV